MENLISLQSLAEEINVVNRNNGWDVTTADQWEQGCKIPADLALITSEVSEALEAFRGDNREHFCEELADILIRTLSLAEAFDDDILKRVQDKVEKNRHRGYRYGGKRI